METKGKTIPSHSRVPSAVIKGPLRTKGKSRGSDSNEDSSEIGWIGFAIARFVERCPWFERSRRRKHDFPGNDSTRRRADVIYLALGKIGRSAISSHSWDDRLGLRSVYTRRNSFVYRWSSRNVSSVNKERINGIFFFYKFQHWNLVNSEKGILLVVSSRHRY